MKMKVRSFYMGLVGGLPNALEGLDAKVTELGDVTIHMMQDTLHKDVNVMGEGGPETEQLMVRVVTYTPKE